MTDDEITIDDRKLHYLVEGEGIPLLWIHGFPLGAEIYHRQLDIGGVMHIVPDLPGFGQSDPYEAPEDATIDQYASDLLELLDALDVERAIVGGLSMGGYVAFDLARVAATRLRGLILIDTKETDDDDETRNARMQSVESIQERGRTQFFVDEMIPKLLSDQSAQNDELVETVRSLMTGASVTAVLAAQHAMARRPDSSAVLPTIPCPTLVVAGSEDVITPPETAERMANAIPDATLKLIEGAGHLPPLECPSEFNEIVQNFLDERFGT
ncbi:MAG: alpha/beta hydrolase [Thermoanaerobaculia bacterium]|nr:alpha/beta hydrolase [Thermoanaerobaculia bacterium]